MFGFACAEAKGMADRAILDHRRGNWDQAYQTQVPDRSFIAEEVHERKDGQPDDNTHHPFYRRTNVLQHFFHPPFSGMSLYLFYHHLRLSESQLA
jgi:hypothetical protein